MSAERVAVVLWLSMVTLNVSPALQLATHVLEVMVNAPAMQLTSTLPV